jgi:hypothetical protein
LWWVGYVWHQVGTKLKLILLFVDNYNSSPIKSSSCGPPIFPNGGLLQCVLSGR